MTERSPSELRAQRDQLIAETGLAESVLRERAEAWQLYPEHQTAWETIKGIDYLLADNSAPHCPTCGPATLEPHPYLPVERCSNCKEHLRAVLAVEEPDELRRPYTVTAFERRKDSAVSDEQTAYERLQQAAAEASKGAGLLALRTLRDVHWECVALEDEWRTRQDPGAEEVRAVVARIRAKLAPAVTMPWGDR